MNIAEILKNAPKGTKLYSPIIGECELEAVYLNSCYPIKTTTKLGAYSFTSEGLLYKEESNGECMLFPSRENRDWNNFYICPFKKGDFIVTEYPDGNKFIAIFSHLGGLYEYTTNYLYLLRPDGKFKPKSDFGIGNIQKARLATDSEKKELLDAMARNGYCWDEYSMTLKELTLKFKVGDTIHKEEGYLNHTIKSIAQDRYMCEDGYFLRFADQNEWNIVKFDINSLKPFDKVLVRDDDMKVWTCGIYSHFCNNDSDYRYVCTDEAYKQCIPYNDDTEHFVGKTSDCPEYYKTW